MRPKGPRGKWPLTSTSLVILVILMRSDEVRGILTDLVRRALTVA